jgi:hypothetical protein
MSNKRYIELYSGNRNRQEYPYPASFEVPFAPTVQNITGKNALDPIVSGAVYYKFIATSSDYYNSEGSFAAGSSAASPVLSPKQTGEALSSVVNYYVGWYIVDTTVPPSNESVALITGYNPSTAVLTLLQPLGDDPTGHKYGIYSSNPTPNYISIPTLDNNQNYILNYELAYNGYYIVFETPNPLYSNPFNSNIFYRTITYYDFATQIAYFDSPLPDGYAPMTPQTFTLRKTLPNERWTLETSTFINSTPPANPAIGPLLGPVITLPLGASTTDNFYTGKFVYYYSNASETYPKEFPPAEIINGNGSPVSGVFFPIYGSYYVKAYNGSTRQLSVCYDLNSTPLPTYIANIGYDSGSFVAQTDLIIDQIGPTEYQATLINNDTLVGTMSLVPSVYTIGKTYQVCWNMQGKPTDASPYFTVNGLNNTILYQSSTISSDYTTVTFTFVPTSSLTCFIIFADTEQDYYIEWDSFVVSQVDTINISCFNKDNFTPLSYNGSMLSINDTMCYEVTLISLSLPNESLLSGSRISFYPYVYVEFANATAPSGASRELIYSNNPNSNNALFVVPITQTVQPLLSTFMVVSSSGMSQVIKFKPNDNLRFSVYLPDGTLFRTLENDIFSPYPTFGRVQIEALFAIRRL